VSTITYRDRLAGSPLYLPIESWQRLAARCQVSPTLLPDSLVAE